VSDSDFFFSIDLSGQPPSNDMFRELVSRILAQAGCAQKDVPAVIAALQTVVHNSVLNGDRLCRLTFSSGDDGLEIAVSSSTGRVYHATHPTS